jgi:hypothetical protein
LEVRVSGFGFGGFSFRFGVWGFMANFATGDGKRLQACSGVQGLQGIGFSVAAVLGC